MTSRDWGRAHQRSAVARQGTKGARDADRPYSPPKPKRDPRPAKDPIGRAAAWLIENRPRIRAAGIHPVPEMKRALGLTAKECAAAIRLANEIEAR